MSKEIEEVRKKLYPTLSGEDLTSIKNAAIWQLNVEDRI